MLDFMPNVRKTRDTASNVKDIAKLLEFLAGATPVKGGVAGALGKGIGKTMRGAFPTPSKASDVIGAMRRKLGGAIAGEEYMPKPKVKPYIPRALQPRGQRAVPMPYNLNTPPPRAKRLPRGIFEPAPRVQPLGWSKLLKAKGY